MYYGRAEINLERGGRETKAVAELHREGYLSGRWFNLGPKGFRGEGSAKASEEDKLDHKIGNMLASGRALIALGRRLQKMAWDEVRERDRVREAEAARLAQEAAPVEKVVAAGVIQAEMIVHIQFSDTPQNYRYLTEAAKRFSEQVRADLARLAKSEGSETKVNVDV